MYSEVSVSVSVLAKTKTFFRFLYQFWPKRKMAVSASFGFGRNEKNPFSCVLDACISGYKIFMLDELDEITLQDFQGRPLRLKTGSAQCDFEASRPHTYLRI